MPSEHQPLAFCFRIEIRIASCVNSEVDTNGVNWVLVLGLDHELQGRALSGRPTAIQISTAVYFPSQGLSWLCLLECRQRVLQYLGFHSRNPCRVKKTPHHASMHPLSQGCCPTQSPLSAAGRSFPLLLTPLRSDYSRLACWLTPRLLIPKNPPCVHSTHPAFSQCRLAHHTQLTSS